jgi:pSer/pThr/pTyr-binding forkhead associated (FHA) protein
MARLLLTYKNKVLQNHLMVEGAVVTIGRHPNNTIVVDNPLVSAQHAKIEHTSQGLKLTDLNSTNGTFVNSEPVSEYQLSHQDWVSVGKHILIIDIYETLSLDATVQMLKAGSSSTQDAEHTMMLDADISQSLTQSLDYLTFSPNDRREDFELSNKMVTIGNNADADIPINGLWSLFAGEPTAAIKKQGGDYFIEYVTGMLKPKINGKAIKNPTRIQHHDIIQVGSIKMQLFRIKRTA